LPFPSLWAVQPESQVAYRLLSNSDAVQRAGHILVAKKPAFA